MNKDIFDKNFFKKLKNVEFDINIKLSNGMQGARKSSAKGVSVEFSDFREYVLGDDFRRIDWNAYGRFNKLFVKLFMEEREAVFNFFIDGSKSMDFGENKKSYTALRLAGALSYIGLNNLDRVCINTLKGTELKSSKSVSGKLIFQKLLKELSNIEFDSKTNISQAIKKKPIKRKGVSIIISDFFDSEGIEDAIKYLSYKKQQIILIHILAKEELDPQYEDMINLVDIETNENIKVLLTPSVKKKYIVELNKFKNNIRKVASKYGASYVEISSEDSIEKIIFDRLAMFRRK